MIPDTRKERPFGLRRLLLLFGICSLMGLYNFSTYLAQHRMEREAEPIRRILLNEMTGAYSLFVLLPFILTFMSRFPVRRTNWAWSVPLHLIFSVLVGASSTTLMTISRTWLYPVFNLRRYDPGQLGYRYLMEYHKQLLIYALIWAIVFLVGRMRAARERERETAELALRASQLQMQLSEARLRSLQGRLQPHFLFNTLNMISSLMYQDAQKADRMMARLSTLLRMSLDTSERSCVPLHQEMTILDVYLDIMEARFGEGLQISRDLDPRAAGVPVPALLLQPLVENAIRHGEPAARRPMEISIRSSLNGDCLRLEVADKGPGLAGDAAAPEGMGLRSIRDRLAQLYGDKARLLLENLSPRGLLAAIELPATIASEMPVDSGISGGNSATAAEAAR